MFSKLGYHLVGTISAVKGAADCVLRTALSFLHRALKEAREQRLLSRAMSGNRIVSQPPRPYVLYNPAHLVPGNCLHLISGKK